MLMAEVDRFSSRWALAKPWWRTTLTKMRSSFRSGKVEAMMQRFRKGICAQSNRSAPLVQKFLN
ncbi:protein of unknown function [Pseudomonas inefficax]|uniref:Uncharacterized protein n=1 Tax=Pseudomonas inefficax TaxID=2078786 RepID=A0AAQ1SVC9_9PSED|nr:protein of unknown function [Pseudomonas inefficax]